MAAGNCPKCGYSLASLPVDPLGDVHCPECGRRGELPAPAVPPAPHKAYWLLPVVMQAPGVVAYLNTLNADCGWCQMGSLLLWVPGAGVASLLLTLAGGVVLRRALNVPRRQYWAAIVLNLALTALLAALSIVEIAVHHKGGC